MDKYKLRMKFERSHFTDADNNITGEITQDYAEYLENQLLEAINYKSCCESDSEQLCKCKIPCGTYEGVIVDKDYCRMCNNLIA